MIRRRDDYIRVSNPRVQLGKCAVTRCVLMFPGSGRPRAGPGFFLTFPPVLTHYIVNKFPAVVSTTGGFLFIFALIVGDYLVVLKAKNRP